MAEEKKNPSWFGKLINWFKCLPGRIATAFKNMVAELHKVTWPSKKKLISSTVTVLVFMLLMGLVVGLLDSASFTAINAMSDVLTPAAETTQTVDGAATTENGTEIEVEGAEVTAEPTEAPVEATTEVPAETTEAPAEAPAE